MNIRYKENGIVELSWNDKTGAKVALKTTQKNAVQDIMKLILGKDGTEMFYNIASLNQPGVLFASLKPVFKNCLTNEEIDTLIDMCQAGDNLDLKFLSIYLSEEDYKDLISMVKKKPIDEIVETAKKNSCNFLYREKLNYVTGNDELSRAIFEDIFGTEIVNKNRELRENAEKIADALKKHFDADVENKKKNGEWVKYASNAEELEKYASALQYPLYARVNVLLFNPAVGLRHRDLVSYFAENAEEIEESDIVKLEIARRIALAFNSDKEIMRNLDNNLIFKEAGKMYRRGMRENDENMKISAMNARNNRVSFLVDWMSRLSNDAQLKAKKKV